MPKPMLDDIQIFAEKLGYQDAEEFVRESCRLRLEQLAQVFRSRRR